MWVLKICQTFEEPCFSAVKISRDESDLNIYICVCVCVCVCVWCVVCVCVCVCDIYHKIMHGKTEVNKKSRTKSFTILAMLKLNFTDIQVLHLASTTLATIQMICCINPALTGRMYVHHPCNHSNDLLYKSCTDRPYVRPPPLQPFK